MEVEFSADDEFEPDDDQEDYSETELETMLEEPQLEEPGPVEPPPADVECENEQPDFATIEAEHKAAHVAYREAIRQTLATLRAAGMAPRGAVSILEGQPPEDEFWRLVHQCEEVSEPHQRLQEARRLLTAAQQAREAQRQIEIRKAADALSSADESDERPQRPERNWNVFDRD
jgi:hypothetical protein